MHRPRLALRAAGVASLPSTPIHGVARRSALRMAPLQGELASPEGEAEPRSMAPLQGEVAGLKGSPERVLRTTWAGLTARLPPRIAALCDPPDGGIIHMG
jgi:hypothetical protein